MSAKRKFVDSVITCLSWAGLPNLLRQFQDEEYCILMLHGITDRKRHEESGIGNTEGIHMHVQDFDAICQLLVDRYKVVSLDEVIRKTALKEALPTGSVVLTFDDGYRSNHDLALPVLEKYGLPATVFLATNFLENRQWQWWDRVEYAIGHSVKTDIQLDAGGSHFHHSLETTSEKRNAFLDLLPVIKGLPQEDVNNVIGHIEERLECSLSEAEVVPDIYQPLSWEMVSHMQAGGLVDFGAHTHTHKILGRCKLETIREELVVSRDLLASRTGIDRPLFSYPNGHIGDHNRITRRELMDLGFRCALTTETGFNSVDSDPFTLKRFSTGNSSHYVDVTASGTMKMLLAVNSAIRGKRKVA